MSNCPTLPRREPATRVAYSPAEAAHALGLSRATIYNLLARGELRSFKIGRSTRIAARDVLALVGGSDAS